MPEDETASNEFSPSTDIMLKWYKQQVSSAVEIDEQLECYVAVHWLHKTF